MNLSLVIDNLLNPAVLFFFLGLVAAWLKSDLEIPKPVARFLSLYLLFSIGMHGGVELSKNGFQMHAAAILGVGVLFSAVTPVWCFFILRRWVGTHDAAAIAATYGSISAVTFVTAVSFLDTQEVTYGGYMVAAMALMESPAIMMGILLARWYHVAPPSTRESPDVLPESAGMGLVREALLNGAVFLLLGSLLIGMLSGERGWEAVKPLAYEPFKGVLCLFLLDMGLLAAKRLSDLRRSGSRLLVFGVVAAVAHAGLAIAAVALLNALGMDISEGDALLLAVLVGSASYIAVPAAMSLAVPQANPGLYIPMALGVTFPFNVAIGIPLYLAVIRMVLGGSS